MAVNALYPTAVLLSPVVTAFNAVVPIAKLPYASLVVLDGSFPIYIEVFSNIASERPLTLLANDVTPSRRFSSVAEEVTPSMMFSSAVVAVTPSSTFNSVVVAVISARVAAAAATAVALAVIEDACVVVMPTLAVCAVTAEFAATNASV